VVDFPSLDFFTALKERMREKEQLFKRLGYFDTTFGLRVLDGTAPRQFILGFEIFDNVRVEQVESIDPASVDFVLEGTLPAWRDMLDNIVANDGADAAHSLNTLTHFGEKLRSLYIDPDAHDRMYRFAESIQEYFNLAAGLDISYPDATGH
jgi:hypothetical protein